MLFSQFIRILIFTAQLKPMSNRVSLFLFIFVVTSLACHTTNKQVSETQSTLGTEVPDIQIQARYHSYTSAMGKGKGVLFTFNLTATDTIIQQMVVDSILLNGRSLPFKITKQTPLVIESNYYKLLPEPSVENPNPVKSVDSLIDLHQFYPAHIFITLNHHSYPLMIDTIILQKP